MNVNFLSDINDFLSIRQSLCGLIIYAQMLFRFVSMIILRHKNRYLNHGFTGVQTRYLETWCKPDIGNCANGSLSSRISRNHIKSYDVFHFLTNHCTISIKNFSSNASFLAQGAQKNQFLLLQRKTNFQAHFVLDLAFFYKI